MGKLYIAMYHYVRDIKNSRYPKIKGLDVSLFKKQLEFFKSNFEIVTMEQVLLAVEGRGGGINYRRMLYYLHLMMDI